MLMRALVSELAFQHSLRVFDGACLVAARTQQQVQVQGLVVVSLSQDPIIVEISEQVASIQVNRMLQICDVPVCGRSRLLLVFQRVDPDREVRVDLERFAIIQAQVTSQLSAEGWHCSTERVPCLFIGDITPEQLSRSFSRQSGS